MFAVALMAEKTTLAANVQRLRKVAGLSQQELAEASGISLSSLRGLEQGDSTDPRMSTIRAIAKALGVTVEAFYQDVPDTPPLSKQMSRYAKRKNLGGDTST